MARILIVEDNENLAYGLATSLELSGHEAAVASDGNAGLRHALSDAPDLVLLDLMLPELDGFRVLKAIRESGSPVPVLILTARGEEADKVTGLRLGADDYVTKPFGMLELLARVEALLRRAAPRAAVQDEEVERFGDVEVNFRSRIVRRAGVEVAISKKGFDLLQALLRRRGAVATRPELLREVWGHRGAVLTRTVDMHIAELRRKLEAEPARPRHIVTVWKVGYRLKA